MAAPQCKISARLLATQQVLEENKSWKALAGHGHAADSQTPFKLGHSGWDITKGQQKARYARARACESLRSCWVKS